MKSFAVILITLYSILLYSCSNNEQKSGTDQTTTTSSDLMKEDPAYDASRIDPSATVVDVTLLAQGNSMSDMQYDKKEIHVSSGSTVKMEFINEGTDEAMLHNFVLIEEGTADTVAHAGLAAGPDKNYIPAMTQVLVSSKVLKPKEKTELTFPAPEKGTYDFICTYPGHYMKMRGKFIVE